MVLAGCETRWNPVNWFGRSQEATLPVAAAETPTIVPQDPRPSVDQVVELTVDRVEGGALITAMGVPATQGWFEADLVPDTRDIEGRPQAEDGELAFRFVAVPPPTPQPAGSPRSRQISASVFVSSQRLEGARTITVKGQTNQRSSRR